MELTVKKVYAMIRILYILFIVILFHSKGIALVHEKSIKYDTNEIKKTSWFVFYQKQIPKLKYSDFLYSYTKVKIDKRTGNIIPDYDPKFSICQKMFSINSPNETCYLDLLSNMVVFNKLNDSCIITGFDEGQEVNLVNRKKKTVTSIGFLGPDLFVEDAVWLDNQKILLMGIIGNLESVSELFIVFIDLKKNESSMLVSSRLTNIYDNFLLNRFKLKMKK